MSSKGRTSAITVYQLLAEPYRSGHGTGGGAGGEAAGGAARTGNRPAVSPTIARQAAQVKTQIGGGRGAAPFRSRRRLAGDSEVYVTQRSTLRRIAGLAGGAAGCVQERDDRLTEARPVAARSS